MRILWITAIYLPAVSDFFKKKHEVTGGWLHSMIEELIKMPKIKQFAVITPCKVKEVKKIEHGKITYYLFPSNNAIFKYDKRAVNYINSIASEFKPDLIDMQGVEFFLARSYIESNVCCVKVATLQGLTSRISKFYLAGILAKDLITTRTIKDNLLLDGLFERRYKLEKRGENEKYVLKELKYVIGRTKWDYSICNTINSDLKYYHCGRNLRESFYGNRIWDIKNIERYSIFVSQAGSPIKGLHFLLEAIYYLKQKYPNIKLYIAGRNMVNPVSLKDRLSFGGYRKYLKKTIKKYSLSKYVIFTGKLSAEEMAEKMCSSHIYVLPSVIENSPNSLGEAQMLGVPSIASLVGGVSDYVEDNKSGLLYNSYEPAVLAHKISEIFINDELAKKLSENGKIVAAERHDRKRNTFALVEIYEDIINDHKKAKQIL